MNGENAAGGLGITPPLVREMLDDLGVDVITLGNHAYRHREVYELLDTEDRIVRPANYPKGNPGRGQTVVERSPFAEADAILADLRGKADHVLIDFHAEATSEKIAMGWHVDGRATACVGTHTHVPTADSRVLAGGTAYISDVGMTGPRGGVIGVKREQAVERFRTLMPIRFDTSEEDPWLNGVLIEAADDGRATAIEQLLVEAPGG